MPKKPVIKAYFFNWAGGTSLIYSPLRAALARQCGSNAGDDSNSLSSSLSRSFVIESIPVDLPGRLVRSTEHAITDIPELAASLIKEIFPAGTVESSNTDENGKKGSADQILQHNLNEPYVLFGHSYGSILAFEVAKQLEERKMQGPMMLFISASRPPSSISLTSHANEMKPVSEMNFEEMVEYFQSRGSTMTMDDFKCDDLRRLFVKSVKVDYKGLEEYVSNDYKVSCPICAIGGDQDNIVNPEQISQWKMHLRRDRIDDGGCEANENFELHILSGRGHFYLNDSSSTCVDSGTPHDLAKICIEGIEMVSGDRCLEVLILFIHKLTFFICNFLLGLKEGNSGYRE
jgi:surfactin synthase thioesterase subunit